jgi:hypothetical protein
MNAMETQTETEQLGYRVVQRRMVRWSFSAIAFTLALWAHTEAATKYRYTKHETLSFPGSHSPIFTGISDQRHLTGEFQDIQGDFWSFCKQGKSETRLYVKGGGSPEGLNDHGVIVGSAGIGRHDCDTAGLWYANDMPLEYSCFTFPENITNAGVEVGSYVDPNDNQTYCYTRKNDESSMQFQVVPGEACHVKSINDKGEMVGYRANQDKIESWVFRNGQFQFFQIPGAQFTYAENIANDGSIQGTYIVEDPSESYTWEGYGFSLAPNGDISVIFVPGAKSTYVKGGNARGDVVGGYFDEDEQGFYHWHAFIANPVQPKVARR